MILRQNLQNGETVEQIMAELPENNNHIANYILVNNGQLPKHPKFEKHPYEYEEYNLGYDKMIIGTFPPISYIYDHPLLEENNIGQNEKPKIPFFHGNLGSMWNSLLIGDLYQEILDLPRNERRLELINELIFRFIRYDDIIKYTRRNISNDKYTAEDKNLFNIIPKESIINDVLQKDGLIGILFNTSTTFSKNIDINVDNKVKIESSNNIKSFDLFIRTIQEIGYKIEFKLDNSNNDIILDWTEVNFQNRNLIKNNFSYKIIFKVRILNEIEIIREFYVITPFSPSARGRVDFNPILKKWLKVNYEKKRNDLLKDIYYSFSLLSDEEEYLEHKEFLYSLNYYH